jgi:hypothetical protein
MYFYHEETLEKEHRFVKSSVQVDQCSSTYTIIVALVAHLVLAQYVYRQAFKHSCFTRYPNKGDIYFHYNCVPYRIIELKLG